MRVGIVGAGMAGLACAERLAAKGAAVVLFDKGHGPGGRMSTRRMPTPLGEAAFDHGAQYFTARDPGFAARVNAWEAAGVTARWPAAGHDAWVGTPGMNAPVRAMAARHDVRWGMRVDALVAGGTWRMSGEAGRVSGAEFDEDGFDAVVIAVPAEQVAALVHAHAPTMAAEASATRSEPCWTVMAAYAERLPVAADCHKSRDAIGWAARNSAKPGRGGPEAWVLQASPAWSRGHLEETPAEVQAALLRIFAAMVGTPLPEPVAAAAHRWRYARSGASGRDMMWDAERGIGACGDWLIGPRVESAWVSGTRLAEAIVSGG